MPIARRDWIYWITSAKKIHIFATLGRRPLLDASPLRDGI